MRFPIPPFASTSITNQSVPVIDTDGREMSVWIQNVSNQTIWLADKQDALDADPDATGNPTYGFQLQPGQIIIDNYFYGTLWARSNSPGGLIECRSNEKFNPWQQFCQLFYSLARQSRPTRR